MRFHNCHVLFLGLAIILLAGCSKSPQPSLSRCWNIMTNLQTGELSLEQVRSSLGEGKRVNLSPEDEVSVKVQEILERLGRESEEATVYEWHVVDDKTGEPTKFIFYVAFSRGKAICGHMRQ